MIIHKIEALFKAKNLISDQMYFFHLRKPLSGEQKAQNVCFFTFSFECFEAHIY